MTRGKRIWALKLLLGAVLYLGAAWFCGAVRGDMAVSHILLDAPAGDADARRILTRMAEEDDPVGFCLWGEKQGRLVSCKETGASAQVTQVLLGGNPELMEAGALYWQKGCLTDGETARRLFGTASCQGQVLWLDGEAYPVLGTVDAPRPTVITMAGEGEEAVFHRGVLAVPGEKGKNQGERFLMQWGLSGKVLDFYPLWAVTANLLALFPGILLLRLWGSVRRKLGRRIPPAAAKGIWLALVLGTLWLLGRNLVIPADMLPTRWSDFAFWGRWWDGQRENLNRIAFTQMGNGQLQMLGNMVKSMGCSTAAALLAVGRRYIDADIADRG